ncbi:IclR family transcriptional regulator [Pikeienuella piscinae]|uniref:IclR family transcriptional regulator n=1 Tax=Pikeienuella piscinae TaxID=2748098 RepID=A0A7L5BTR2_9RHOB|nr:IclR family transcriptional regulator [Pikeienuella piscinae]QIE55045.1 IclR family transcriptional regulator [Pikeienuella piscinae]
MIVRQARNVLRLLEFFAEKKAPATLAEISAAFGWPRSSTYNILTTLSNAGFLYEPRARAGFYPTPRWLQLAQEIAEAEPIPEALTGLIHDLAEGTGETVWISAPSGLHAVMLHVVESRAPVRYAARPGDRVPIHATASGQALLAQMPSRDVDVILRKADYVRYGAGTPMTRAEVLKGLEEGKARGWFASASNYSADLGGVAAPVAMAGRIFAVTVAGPLFRVGDRMEETAKYLIDALAALTPA